MMYSCGHNEKGEAVPEYWALLPHKRMPLSSGQCPKCVTRTDLENHPELTPIVDINADGEVVCFGWASPIYTFSCEFLDEIEEETSDD